MHKNMSKGGNLGSKMTSCRNPGSVNNFKVVLVLSTKIMMLTVKLISICVLFVCLKVDIWGTQKRTVFLARKIIQKTSRLLSFQNCRDGQQSCQEQ